MLRAESTVVAVDPDELVVLSRQVARYAGGVRYRMAASQRKLADTILQQAAQLVAPEFVYSVHEVSGSPRSDCATLANGLTFSLPKEEQDDGIKYLAFCVATIGESVEQPVRTMMSTGAGIEGLFLDAAAVAFLDALSAKAYQALQEQARGRLLRCGCRFGPGYGELDLALQKKLFTLVDAAAIGVRLNESCIMIPAKSFSFFTKWTASKVSYGSRNKCTTCTLTHCPYRL